MTDRINKDPFKEIEPGQRAESDRVFTQSDFNRFAALSGDDNPIHVDPVFAARTKFERTVAHGMLLYSTVCALVGKVFPGVRQLTQALKFPSPTFAGEKVSVQLEIIESDPEKGTIILKTQVIRPGGQVGLEGQTRVALPGARWPLDPGPTPVREPTDHRFKSLALGQAAETRRIISEIDLEEYANLTGDTNPLFVDARYARQQGLAGPIIPGGLISGLFSYLLGTQLPGPGTNYLKQHFAFLAPAHPGQELHAAVEIHRIRADKQLVNLRTTCSTPDGLMICRGEALVLVSDMET